MNVLVFQNPRSREQGFLGGCSADNNVCFADFTLDVPVVAKDLKSECNFRKPGHKFFYSLLSAGVCRPIDDSAVLDRGIESEVDCQIMVDLSSCPKTHDPGW